MSSRWLAGCLAAALTYNPSAARSDYFPFAEGVLYEYQRVPEHFGLVTAQFAGTAVIEGASTQVLWFSDGLRQFWSESPEGDKFLHGTAFRDEAPLSLSPPIPYVDEPLHIGKTWSLAVRDSDGFEAEMQFEVVAFGDIAVPAGTFKAFTIRDIVTPVDGAVHAQSSATRSREHGLWPSTATFNKRAYVTNTAYVAGVGRVSILSHGFGNLLRSWGSVGVQPATWSAVRQLYR